MMKNFLYSTSLIFWVIVFQLLGCSENPEIDIAEEMDAEAMETLKLEPIATTPTPAIIFEQLRNEFAGRLENQGDFTALRNITTSETYLDFLARVYPTEIPVETLEEYFQVASPDTERYTPLLKRWTGNPTEEEIALIHWLTVNYREANFTLFKEHHAKQQEVLNVILIFRGWVVIIGDLDVEEFTRQHQIPLDAFADAVGEFAAETQKADAIWLHEQIEEHGTDLGLLWSAIHKPALIGEILQNFSSIDLFLKWVNEMSLKGE